MPVNRAVNGKLEWRNWSGRQQSAPVAVHQPRTEEALVEAVLDASHRAVPLRAVGASHSHYRVAATDGVLVETDHWSGLATDPAADNTPPTEVTLRAGTRIFQCGPLLFPHGVALRNQGDIDRQSIVGAAATGTHGTGPTLQNFSASVTALKVITADGNIRSLDAATQPDHFAVARQGLGGVGLLSEVTVAVRPRYRLHERLWTEPPGTVMGRIDELIAATRHFEFFWAPTHDVCACKSLDETDEPVDPMIDNRKERVGWSHEILPSVRNDRHTEMEYSVPAENGPACFEAIRQLMISEFPDVEWPVEYRTLAADDGWISSTGGQPTVTISVHQDVALDDEPFFRACEEVFLGFGGRPHWGKVHYLDGATLNELYPRWRRWWEVRDELDPNGAFLTPELAALRP